MGNNMLALNKTYNMDCIDGMKLIPDESIDCCITDCPYKIIAWWVRIIDEWDECSGVLRKRDYSKTDPKWCLNRWRIVVSDWTACSNKRLKKGELNIPSAVKNWKMFEHNDLQFSDWLPELYRIMKPKTHTYIMINGRNLKELQVECEKVWFKYQNLLVWEKWNYTPNKYYMQWAEFILLLSKNWSRNINNMWSKNIIKVPNIIGGKQHPTEKPVALYVEMLLNSTNEWDIVIDPFAWCWPISLSAHLHDRNFIWFELDVWYRNIANKRIQDRLLENSLLS